MAIFSFFMSDEKRFDRNQAEIVKVFAETEKLRHAFNKADRQRQKRQDKHDEFVTANSNLAIAADTVENQIAQRRLKRRKYFTVGADTVLSIPTINLMFNETINWRVTPIMAVILGALVSYGLLRLAIDFRNDDRKENDAGWRQCWNQYSYIAPLTFIPFLSFYLVFSNPGNPTNVIWIFFLSIAFILNIKAASYSRQYTIMEQTSEAKKQGSTLEKAIEASNRQIERIGDRMQSYKQKITNAAIELRQLWERFPEDNKPRVFILPQYLFVLNTRIYYNDVLPIGDINLTLPSGTIGEYLNFWEAAINDGAVPQIPSPSSTRVPPQQQIPTEGDLASENNSTVQENVEIEPDQEDAPGFGTIISDNERYV